MPLHTTDAIIIGGSRPGRSGSDRRLLHASVGKGPRRGGRGPPHPEHVRRTRPALQPGTAGLLRTPQQDAAQGERVRRRPTPPAPARGPRPDRAGLDRGGGRGPGRRGRASPLRDLYQLLAEALDQLEAAGRPAVVLQGFLLHLLRLLGYRPEFSECVRCRGRSPPASEAHLSPASGALVCASCRAGPPTPSRLSPEALGFLRGAGGSTLRLMDRIAPAACHASGRSRRPSRPFFVRC